MLETLSCEVVRPACTIQNVDYAVKAIHMCWDTRKIQSLNVNRLIYTYIVDIRSVDDYIDDIWMLMDEWMISGC